MRFPRVLIALLTFLLLMVGIEDRASGFEYLEYLFEISKELTAHRGPVRSVVFSPDGHLIASGSTDSTVKLWDADSGKQIKALMRHPFPILCVAFSSDSGILAAGSEAGTISLWDVNYRERIRTLKGHKEHVWSICFSHDGALLASGSQDSTIRLWDMGSGKEIRTFSSHTDSVHSVSFSPDSKVLASGSADGTVKVWDIKSGKDILTLKESTGHVNSVCFSPDGKTLASGSGDGIIRLWDVASGKETGTFSGHGDAIGVGDCLSFSPDGRILVSGSADNRILVWDISSGDTINELETHTGAVDSIAFSPDGRRMVSADLDGAAKLWKIRVIESLGITLDAKYEGWQRGTLKLKADVLGLPDVVRFQYSPGNSEWLDIAEVQEPPYSVDWNTRSSIPDLSKDVRLRVIAERTTGTTAMDAADGIFAVDNEPPNTEHDYDGLWHKADFHINLTADDGSGIGLEITKYKLDYGPEKSTRWNGQPRITKEGTNALEYWSVDELGNEEPHKLLSDVKLDKAAPMFSDWIKRPENLAEGFAGRFRVSVQVMDGSGSGLAGKIPRFDYHIGSDTAYDGYEDMFEEGDNLWYYNIPESPEGWDYHQGKSIYYKVICEDVAGNVGESAEQQELIGSTRTPPTVKMTSAFRNWENGLLAIEAEASDADGVVTDVRFEYSLDNVTWIPIGASATPPYSVEWDTTADIPEFAEAVWVQSTATDNDGLSAKDVTPSFGIDNQPPVTNHDYDGLWHKMDFAVNLTADDGDGSGISSVKCKLNGGYERDVLIDGQPKIYEQGKNALEYWSIDVSGNEEIHKVLSDVKLDRLAPFFENWHAERDDNILRVEVNIVDADSGLGTTPQFDYHIGSDTRYSGYKEMEKIDNDVWKYEIDISSYLPDAIGKTAFCKASAKDAVGNLGINMWEYEITGVGADLKPGLTDVAPSPVSEPTQEEDIDISPAPVSQGKGKRSSIVWTVQTSGTINIGEEVEIQGQLKPEMNRPVSLDLTVIAPNDIVYVSRMDADPDGAFESNTMLTSEGEWKIFADWGGDSEYEPARSKALTFQVVLEKSVPDTDTTDDTAKKAGRFLKRNTMIIGVLFLYILIIRLYRN